MKKRKGKSQPAAEKIYDFHKEAWQEYREEIQWCIRILELLENKKEVTINMKFKQVIEKLQSGGELKYYSDGTKETVCLDFEDEQEDLLPITVKKLLKTFEHTRIPYGMQGNEETGWIDLIIPSKEKGSRNKLPNPLIVRRNALIKKEFQLLKNKLTVNTLIKELSGRPWVIGNERMYVSGSNIRRIVYIL